MTAVPAGRPDTDEAAFPRPTRAVVRRPPRGRARSTPRACGPERRSLREPPAGRASSSRSLHARPRSGPRRAGDDQRKQRPRRDDREFAVGFLNARAKRGGASGRATSLKKSKKDAANRIAASYGHGRGSSRHARDVFSREFHGLRPDCRSQSALSARTALSAARRVSDRESDRLAPRAPRRHSVFRAARRIAPPSSGVSLEPGRAGVTTPRK